MVATTCELFAEQVRQITLVYGISLGKGNKLIKLHNLNSPRSPP